MNASEIYLLSLNAWHARHVIDNREEISVSQIILRMPLPGQGDQNWHVDWVPRRKMSDPVRSVLCSLLLDDFTKENGATRIVPGTHNKLYPPAKKGIMKEIIQRKFILKHLEALC